MAELPAAGFFGMHELICQLPEQLQASAGLEGLDDLAGFSADFDEVLVCGMGGSAIAGDLVQPLLCRDSPRVSVWRNYGLPDWAGPGTLVISQSYSGNTEETLSGLDEAEVRGCPRVALTSGGTLLERARAAGSGAFPAVILPGGLPPRASLGLGLGGLIRILSALGALPDAEVQLSAAVSRLQSNNRSRGKTDEQVPAPEDPDGNSAVQELAERLHGRLPVIYTAGAEARPVGWRWRAQLNENSKVPAYLAEFPELDHNDLVGWELADDQHAGFVLLVLTGGPLAPRLRKRVDTTLDLLSGEFADIERITATGDTVLERLMSLVQYGDFLSCYLARARGVDPVPVERIENLKTALAASAEDD